ncbi:hypothetical protein QBC45DRAFT_419712 [Copromyces sp. CBS 386.78]|nr:hypothetical protein QBC45DRAFT_419712 [Copromyces sp. CBS 386.78]
MQVISSRLPPLGLQSTSLHPANLWLSPQPYGEWFGGVADGSQERLRTSPPQGHDSIDGDVLHPGNKKLAGDGVHSEGSIVSFLLPLKFSSTPSTAPLRAGSGMLPTLHYSNYALIITITKPRSLAGFTGETRQIVSVRCQHGTDRPTCPHRNIGGPGVQRNPRGDQGKRRESAEEQLPSR